MALHRLRPVGERLLQPVVPFVRWTGLTAAMVSGLALLTAVGAAISFTRTGNLLGVVFLTVSGGLDLLDGMLAREQGTAGPAGFLLDQTIDRYADLCIVVGLSVGVDAYYLGLAAVTGVLMTSFVGLGAKAVGVDCLLTGGFCRADRLAIIAIAGTITAVTRVNGTPLLLLLIAVGGHLTAIVRFYRIYQVVSSGSGSM